MNNIDRLNLQKMINANDVEDMTGEIRRKNHSELIRLDVNKLVSLKTQYKSIKQSNPDQFTELCIEQCSFLFNNYTDIFNKIKNDEIDLSIFASFLNILKQIENGNLDQHTASYQVGSILKKLYIDSAIRKSNQLEAEERNQPVVQSEPKKISWSQWKILEQ